MKLSIFSFFIYTIIFLNVSICNAQNKRLIIKNTDTTKKVYLNKLHYKKDKISFPAINKELKSLKTQLNKLGYLNPKIIKEKENDSIFYVKIILNQKIDSIKLSFQKEELKSFFLKRKNLDIDLNFITIPFEKISSFINDVNNHFQSNGNVFNRINLTNFKIRGNQAYALINIINTKRRTADKIIINGYDNFPEKYIPYLLSNKTTFNNIYIKNLSDRIKAIPFVSQIKKPQTLFLKDSTLLYVYLKKRKKSSFDGLIGFNSNKKNKLNFNGYLNLDLINIFNKGEQLKVKWESAQEQFNEIDILFKSSYLFKTKFALETKFNILNKDSSYINSSFKGTINYLINHKNKIGFIYNTKDSNSTLKIKNNFITDFNTKMYGISYFNIKKSNNLFYNNKSFMQFESLYGKINDHKQLNMKLTFTYLLKINSKNYLFLSNINMFKSTKQYFENDLQLIGGKESIRGFKESSIPTNEYNILNLDYNYIINNYTTLYSITDLALSKYKFNSKKNLFYSFGLGYKTLINKSKLDINYTIGLTENSTINSNLGILNINFKSYF